MIDGLQPETLYLLRVEAWAGSEYLGQVEIEHTTDPINTFNDPINVNVIDNSVELSWETWIGQSSVPADPYKLYVNGQEYTTSDTEFTIQDLDYDTYYEVFIEALEDGNVVAIGETSFHTPASTQLPE